MWAVATGKAPFAADLKQLSPVLLVMRLLLGQRPTFEPHHDQVHTPCKFNHRWLIINSVLTEFLYLAGVSEDCRVMLAWRP